MPINRQAYTINPFSRPASGGVAYQCNPSNYGNATTKVINLNNNNWLGDSVVFTVDSAWRYVVHVRNSHNGASSIHIDDVRVYGKNTATYLLCESDTVGYRFGFNGMEKDDEVKGIISTFNNDGGNVNGTTTYDGKVISIEYKNGRGDILNHELLHGYQYLTGDLVRGGYASDIGDEILAKRRGFAYSKEHDVGGATAFSEINYYTIYPMYKGTVSTFPLNANSTVETVMLSHTGNLEIQSNLELLKTQLMKITLSYAEVAKQYYEQGNTEQFEKIIQQMKNAQETFQNTKIGDLIGK